MIVFINFMVFINITKSILNHMAKQVICMSEEVVDMSRGNFVYQ